MPIPLEELIVVDRKTARFSACDWFDPLNMPDVFILGCGNIGSWIALGLARMNCKIHLYDHDTIEEENLGCQLYSRGDIGLSKEQITKAWSNGLSDNNNIFTYGKYEKNSMSNPIVFCCVDSMKTRKLAFNKWKEQEDRELFIDTRNAVELTECYCVTKGREREYEQTLYSDAQANDLPCNLKSTQHCSWIGASLMVSCFTNYLANKNIGFDLRTVPYYQSFEVPFFEYQVKE